MNAPRAIFFPALLALALLAARATADEADVDAHVALGDEALGDEEWEQAVGHYKQALAGDPNRLPARHGLGEALLGAGKADEAVLAFRQAVRTAEGMEHVTGDAADAVRKSRKRLAKLDPRGMRLEELLDDHAKDLVKLAGRFKTKDPDLCNRALDIALTLRPEHEGGRRLRTQMQARGARVEKMFDGEQILDWDGGKSQWWSVANGVIVGDAGPDIATYIRTEKQVEGDFDVVVEWRMTKAYEGSPYFALMGAWTKEYCHSRLGVLSDAVTWTEYHTEDDQERVFRRPVKDMRKALDLSKWNTFELRYRGDEVTAAVNGREVQSVDRKPTRAKGFVGLLAQECRVEVRRVDVLHR